MAPSPGHWRASLACAQKSPVSGKAVVVGFGHCTARAGVDLDRAGRPRGDQYCQPTTVVVPVPWPRSTAKALLSMSFSKKTAVGFLFLTESRVFFWGGRTGDFESAYGAVAALVFFSRVGLLGTKNHGKIIFRVSSRKTAIGGREVAWWVGLRNVVFVTINNEITHNHKIIFYNE